MDTIIESKLQNKNELTNEQQKCLEEIEKINGCITIIELSRLLNKKYTTLYTMIRHIEKNGYNIREKIRDNRKEKKAQEQEEKRRQKEIKKKELKKREKEVLDILEENNYNIPFVKIANRLGRTRSFVTQIVDRLEEKGYNIRGKMEKEKQTRKQELTEAEKTLLCIEEENNYEASLKMVNEKIEIRPNIIPDLLKKFIKSALETDDAIRVANFIKNKRKLPVLERHLRISNKIWCDNISILIDELLKDEEASSKEEIDFIIRYAEILLEKNITQVQGPLNQLLKEHEVQLTKRQALEVEKIMSDYRTKMKEMQNSGEEEKKNGEQDEEIEVNEENRLTNNENLQTEELEL